MFTNKKKEKEYYKLLGITEEEFTEFAKRFKHYLLTKNNITSLDIKRGFFILEDIKNKQIEKKIEIIKELNFKSFKNLYVKKYNKDIVDAYRFGYGAKRISKMLKLEHNAKISPSTIERFIKINKIVR